MKLHASLLVISLFHILFALDSWKESQDNGGDYSLDNTENENLEEFSGNDIFGESQMSTYAKSMRNNRNEIQKLIPNEMKSKKTAFYQSSHNITPCSCGMEYKVLDLGHLYFPRYIHSMICKDGTCRNPYRCSERYYKVRVLKKNPHDRSGRPSSMLPANLRQYWTSETIDVVVGCECIP
ncbi:prothoracicotropic hormone-like [Harmonia axyridis]|uniref:prothoracicotropic hormone-like n=1 Tax=Harmonia axyridis TaxID=115357 RepID=UPI001E276614|nr:prothoracicotropic hormone-like [Harmonia axyridis]